MATLVEMYVSQMVLVRQDQIITPPDEFLPMCHDPVDLIRPNLHTETCKRLLSHPLNLSAIEVSDF